MCGYHFVHQGTVKLVFQPSEEGYGGAYYVLQEGALDDASAIFGMHVDLAVPVAVVASRPGPFTATAGRYLATIHGEDGHAAIPHESIDPVVVASTAILSLQQIVAREVDPLHGAVSNKIYCSPLQKNYVYGVLDCNIAYVCVWIM